MRRLSFYYVGLCQVLEMTSNGSHKSFVGDSQFFFIILSYTLKGVTIYALLHHTAAFEKLLGVCICPILSCRWEHSTNATPQSKCYKTSMVQTQMLHHRTPVVLENPGKKWPFSHNSKSGHRISTQVNATIGYPWSALMNRWVASLFCHK